MSYRCVRSPFGFSAEPLPSIDDLRRHYAETYYQTPKGQYSKQYSDDELEFLANKADITLAFAAMQGVASGRVLDLGCGEGFFLKAAAARGFSIYGVDHSLYGVEAHNPELLQKGAFLQGDLLGPERHFQQGLFDLVFCKNVMEHVIDPVALLERVRGYLSSDGIAIVEVPNDFSCLHDAIFVDVTRENIPVFCPPEHLHYFNTETLRETLQSHGFAVLDAFSDYPIDHLLLEPYFDYYADRSVGPRAHALRKRVMALIARMPIERAAPLLRGFYGAGIGRDISAVVRKQNKD